MLSSDYLKSLREANFMDSLFYICFFLCLNLFLLIFFIAIILSNYNKMKGKINLTAAALSRITAHKSELVTQKWLNLFCMKPPIDDEIEIKSTGDPPSTSEKCKSHN